MSSPRNIYGAMEAFHKCKEPAENLKRFETYLKLARSVFKLVGVATDDDKKEKLLLWGGDDMKRLYMNTGKVKKDDTFEEAMKKIRIGLTSMVNNVKPVYKLFHEMPQEDRLFFDWINEVLAQARLCPFEDYTAERAARDAVVIQTKNENLRKIALREGTTFNELVELGCALEFESQSDNQESEHEVEEELST